MILIAYDGSEDARAAVTQAAALFGGEQAVVLTVWQRFVDTMARAGTALGVPTIVDLGAVDSASETAARETAEAGAAQARELGLDARIAVESVVTTITEAVLHAAADTDAKAIVIGTRGLTGIKSVLLGSVSTGVLHHADRPVVIVPSPQVAQARAEHLAEH